MSALAKTDTTIDYDMVATVSITMQLRVAHDINTSYPPSHSDLDMLLQSEARGDALDMIDWLRTYAKHEKLPIMTLALEKVEKLDVKHCSIR